ncbi:hypothetical protein B0H13DRAFT_2337743 [Mycena leptocephala]|nr:hypothetical protein B0H13DRAFT_2337743 [Mycena leptocephala]
MSFAELPSDLLLQLGKELPPDALLNLLQICRSMRQIQSERSLWLDALAYIQYRQRHPLPVLGADNLDMLSVQELQTTVRRVIRLMKNWDSEAPQPFVTTKFSVTSRSEVHCIPGSGLLVEVTSNPRRINCWQILTGTCVAGLEVTQGLRIETEACMDTNGKVLFGARIGGWPPTHVAAVTIDLHARPHVSISCVVSSALDDTSQIVAGGSCFLNSKFMGWCSNRQIGTWSMKSGDPVRLHMYDSPRIILDNCQLFGRHVYAVNGGLNSQERGVDRILVRDSDGGRSNGISFEWQTAIMFANPSTSNQGELQQHTQGVIKSMTRMVVPHCGVFAVIHERFTWSGAKSGGCFYQHTRSFYGFTVGASGTYALGWATEGEDISLGLLHFCATRTPQVTFRTLDTGALRISRATKFILDESLGLVLATDYTGMVTVLHYM